MFHKVDPIDFLSISYGPRRVSAMWNNKIWTTISGLKLLKTIEDSGNTTWYSSTETQTKKREVGTGWLTHLNHGACGPGHRDRGMKCSSAFYVSLLCISIISSVWVFQKTQPWPPSSHLDHLSIRKKRTLPSGSRKWCRFPWCKYSHPGQCPATTLRPLDGESGRDVHRGLSRAWLSRWEQVQASSSTPLSTPHSTPLHTHLQKPELYLAPAFKGMFGRRQRRKSIISRQCGNC